MQNGPILLVVLLVVILAILYRRNRNRIREERGAMFNESLSLFDSCRVTQDGTYFPVLEGRYRDHDFKIELILDSIVMRQIPSLWMLVSLRAPVPYRGVVDFLVRPKNTEFYSPTSKLKFDLIIPDNWPQHAVLRTDDPDRLPPKELIDPHMNIFQDLKAKELLVTPNGVRIVYLAKNAVRAHYMVLRQAHFENLSLSPSLVRALMDRTIALYEDLSAGQSPPLTAAEPPDVE